MTSKIFLPFLFLFIATLAAASCPDSIDTPSASVSSATTGTSVVISASVTVSGGCSGETVRLVSSGPGGAVLSVSDPASGSYTLSSTQTYSFTATAGTAGAYTYYIQAGSTSSTSQAISFSDPSVITVIGNSANPSNNSDYWLSSTTPLRLSFTLSNPQATAIATAYRFGGNYTDLGTITTTGDPNPGTASIPASSSVTLSWTLTASTSHYQNRTVLFQVGDESAVYVINLFATTTTTASTTSTTATTTGSNNNGGGSTGSGSSSTTSTTLPKTSTKQTDKGGEATIKEAQAGEEVVVKFTPDIVAKADVLEVRITPKTKLSNVKITVEKLDIKPTGLPNLAGKVHYYLSITGTGFTEADLTSAKISFRVAKKNVVKPSAVLLFRYAQSWKPLNTTVASQDDTYYVFTSNTPGFSYFAVTESISGAPGSDVVPGGDTQSFDWTPIISLVVVVIALAAAYWYMSQGTTRRRGMA